MRIDFTINNADDPFGGHLTEGAVQSMVGQSPRIVVDGDHEHPGQRGKVVAAALDGDAIVLTVDIPEKTVDRFSLADEHWGMIGYTVRDAVVEEDGTRFVRAVRLQSCGPSSAPPAPATPST